MANILLIEPDYKCKQPPLGLMKISFFHKNILHDYVRFTKGKLPEALSETKWDRVYVTTLFTFEWKSTIAAIQYAKTLVDSIDKIVVGGIAATLLPDQIFEETGIRPICGLLNEPGKLGLPGDECIDQITPDYSMLEDVDYVYPFNDAYFLSATKGCGNKCGFCAVQTLEPTFIPYIDIKDRIKAIDERFGPKKDLILMDNTATQIVIDASKLSKVLADDSQADVTVIDVLESVYTVTTASEREEVHYFTVQMDSVDVNSKLLSLEDVEDYLTQNAPVPYSPDFIWGKEIVKRLKKEGLEIGVYNISLEYGTKSTHIYKPYKDEFVVDKGKNITDTVQDIAILKIPNDSNTLTAIGWLAKTNYMGSIYDKTVKGIRLRKGNILIGDHQTLNVVFKDARFNGWSIGEIFAIDKLLVPNARRDNFEKNPAYFSLFEQLMTIAAGITKDIRAASLKRNTALSSAIEQLSTTAQQAATAIDAGVSGVQKGLITKKLKEAQIAVSNSTADGDSEQYYQDIAFAELDMLIGKLKGTTKYKALNTIDNLTTTEKKILERVIQVVDALDIDCADTIIDAIISEFST